MKKCFASIVALVALFVVSTSVMAQCPGGNCNRYYGYTYSTCPNGQCGNIQQFPLVYGAVNAIDTTANVAVRTTKKVAETAIGTTANVVKKVATCPGGVCRTGCPTGTCPFARTCGTGTCVEYTPGVDEPQPCQYAQPTPCGYATDCSPCGYTQGCGAPRVWRPFGGIFARRCCW